LRALQTDGLVTTTADRWTVTERGRQAQERGNYARTIHERRSFSFVESEAPGHPPHFLDLDPAWCTPWSPAEGWRFDPVVLTASVAWPDEWKRHFGFPTDVQEIVTGDRSAAPPAWLRVVVDRPERLTAVVVRTEAGKSLGFNVRQENWALQSESPAFNIDHHGTEVFPELAEGTLAESWQQAWLSWCQPRSLTGLGAENCGIVQVGHRVRVTVPPRLLERLRATRSDALKGEAWLLGGTGRLRAAGLLEIVEEGAQASTSHA
jgi:hypothetical protein